MAERKNRAIVGEERDMLHDQKIPLFLWVAACNIVMYLQNRSPHSVLASKTPEEDFSRKKPEIGHIKIFGYLTYSHVPKEKRTNMEHTKDKGILRDYGENYKSYHIYIPM